MSKARPLNALVFGTGFTPLARMIRTGVGLKSRTPLVISRDMDAGV